MQNTDYRNTLNLPKTKFPMKANLRVKEKEILKFWEGISLYTSMQEKNKEKEKFIIHDGPPYANGKIHLGTSLNKILKDIILKSKNFSGYHTPYIPGWDCHGLPIELKVEKKVGKVGVKISESDFRDKCKEYAKKQVEGQCSEFKRLGVIADWNNPYLTMDQSYSAEVVRITNKLLEKKHMIRREKPVYWCIDCRSSLAEAEVEYMNKKSKAIDVMFQATSKEKVYSVFSYTDNQDLDVFFPIWTTTPWTIPSNQAICLNPNINYALVLCKINDSPCTVVLAEDLVQSSIERFSMTDKHSVLSIINGKALKHTSVYHPIYNSVIPVIFGHHVTTREGTGNVHTAPAHGLEDYLVCLEYNIVPKNSIDNKGYFQKNIEIFSGKKYLDAEGLIINNIENRGLLSSCNIIEHSYPHCWRHKTPLIFRATPQLFILMEGEGGLRNQALNSIDSVKWIPGWGGERMKSMVRSRPDWCVSRQRFWGNPVALLLNKKTEELHTYPPASIKNVADNIEEFGNNYWFNSETQDLIKEGNREELVKIQEVLDVWFDSGVTHECVLKKRDALHFPADLYLEGSDQYRGWFQSSLLTSIMLNKKAPYKAVLTHGFVVDADGKKMSKSLGNTVSPEKIINEFGADILRLWVASSNFKEDIAFSNEIISRISDAYRRIRNTIRFLLSNLYDFNPERDRIEHQDLLSLDAWVLERVFKVQEEILDAFQDYQFQTVYKIIHNFCTMDMGSFYLDIIKDRLYTSTRNGRLRKSAQNTMHYILECLVRWIAPILSFTAEEAWSHMTARKEKSVFLTSWLGECKKNTPTQKNNIDWGFLRKVRNEVNKSVEAERQNQGIKSTLDAEITIYASGKDKAILESIGDEIRFLFISANCAILPIESKPMHLEKSPVMNLFIDVKPCKHNKCARCWQRQINKEFSIKVPGICLRCEKNIDNIEECRTYV